MTKYIVKNCPALIDDGGCYRKSLGDDDFYCKDRTDCIVKQTIGFLRNSFCNGGALDCFVCRVPNCNHKLNDFVHETLEKWEIEEC